MLRFIGGLCVCSAATYAGFYMSGSLKKRRDFFRAMSYSLSFILREIEFGHSRLIYTFRQVCDNPSTFGFFNVCINETENMGVRNAWSRAVAKCGNAVGLKKEECETLSQLGAEIGMSDISGQKNAILRTIAHLDKYENMADEEYIRLGKTYKSCGVLLGVFCMIIII